ncbi:MAG: ribonuclease P protein component [Nitrospirae bacterium]|nr:ribonuclease P protein component [Nitrospirota bacterium]MBI3594260.1 ribonuclease P protein component [Nitrospirota bacterium]
MKESSNEIKIKKSREIQSIFEKGQKVRGKHFDLIFLENRLSFFRIGLIVGKKCGRAVERNYIKRIFREIIYRRKWENCFSVDMLVVPKGESKTILFSNLKEEFFSSVQKILRQGPHLKN